MGVFNLLLCVSRAGTREVHNKLEKNRFVLNRIKKIKDSRPVTTISKL